MSDQTLVVRADANVSMGTGHLMRCLALAQAWQVQGKRVIFITACNNDSLCRRLTDENFEVVSLPASYPDPVDKDITLSRLTNASSAWVALDGYHLDTTYQRYLKAAGHRLLVIDDTAHLNEYCTDILLNQNINADQLTYSLPPTAHCLLGLRYALLRREFWPWRGQPHHISQTVRRILVTLGGSDPDNQTLKVMQALQRLAFDGLEVVVVVGGSNPHLSQLKAVAAASSLNFRLVHNVRNMPDLMAWADVTISAGGSTCWELAFMGLPQVIIVLADNQRGMAQSLSETGLALNLGWFEQVTEADIINALLDLINEDGRRQMSRQGQMLVDGRGSHRVLEVMDQ